MTAQRTNGLESDDCHHDQVRAAFESVTYGVSAAIVAAIVLAYYILQINASTKFYEMYWVVYILSCGICHICLYYISRSHSLTFIRGSWRTRAFLCICLAEGLGWGASPFLVYNSPDVTAELFTLLDVAGLAAGSVVAFGPYLPAFACFFITSVSPMAIVLTISPDIKLHTAGLFSIICFFGIGSLGVLFNRNFKTNILLRLNSNRIARELKLQKDIAEKANIAKSQFLAAASHDLRQPIHAIGLYIGALRNSNQISEIMSIIDKIENSIVDMDILFSGILDISRLDAGAVISEQSVFSIQKVIDKICMDQRAEAALYGLDLRIVKCGKNVDADPVIIERILRNLVSNALRYTQTGKVLVGARRCGAKLRIEVWDTGCGIALEHQDKIFDEFYQVNNLERDRTKGLGLGLAIVKRLTTLIGSQLLLNSNVDRGSCFAFTLPIARSGPVVQEASPNLVAAAQGSGLIAFVDDELAIRDAMSSLLERWGYTVISAESGDDLVRNLRRQAVAPDLLICDYRLRAGETGHDVIRRIRSISGRHTPAMLITGDTAPERIAEAESGDALVLHKPVPNGKLRAAIISHLVRPAASAKTAG